MNPELMAAELVDYLWTINTNSGKLFKMINENGFLVTKSGIKWSIDPENNFSQLERYVDKPFYYLSQQQIKSREKLVNNCFPIFNHRKIIGHDVVVDFIIKMLNEMGTEILGSVSIQFTHIIPANRPKCRLLC